MEQQDGDINQRCTHDIVMKDMCAICGKDLREKDGFSGQRIEASSANISMVHNVPELLVSEELAKEIGNRDQDNVLKSRKLVLLVDLDQTLVHTTNRQPMATEKSQDIITYRIFNGIYSTKIRPYTREFLDRVSRLYEMHIISFGQRQYTHKIAELLDPEKVLFGHRIMSRDELFSAMHKTRNLKALFPCGEELIAIIDDRPDVWQYSDALVRVKPYKYFKDTGDINAPGTSTQVHVPIEEEDDLDNILEDIERVLTDIHTSYYKHYDEENKVQDVKLIISWLRSQVLRDEVIVFSGIIPLGVDPQKTDAYQLCIQFGAKVEENVNEKTTVVIAGRAGTDKFRKAQKLNIPVVTLKWLYTCCERWLKVDKHDFELNSTDHLSITENVGPPLIGQLAQMPVIAKHDIQDMEHEVEEVLSEESEDEENDEQGDDDEQEEDLGLDRELPPLVDEDDELLRNSMDLKARRKRTTSEETYGEEDESFRPPPTKVAQTLGLGDDEEEGSSNEEKNASAHSSNDSRSSNNTGTSDEFDDEMAADLEDQLLS